MPGPRTTTVGPKRIKSKRPPIRNGSISPQANQRTYMGTPPGVFKAGSGTGFGYTGSMMGGRNK